LEKAEKPKIIVAGGGIGGFTASLSLIKRGFEVEIYEQAPILREVGAGVQISANGMLVFRELGLSARIMEEAAHPERREIRMWNTGQAWTAFDLGTVSVQTYGHPYVTMYRPDLLDILSDAVTTAAPGALRLGHRAVSFEIVGERVILRFNDGSNAEGHGLIGADGIHSVIRAGLHGSDNAEFTGLVAWRGKRRKGHDLSPLIERLKPLAQERLDERRARLREVRRSGRRRILGAVDGDAIAHASRSGIAGAVEPQRRIVG